MHKKWKFFKQKNVKITKPKHAFKGFASSCNVEILNSFNTELLLKETESSIKTKLIYLLTQLKGFKFRFSVWKMESEDKAKYDTFYANLKAEIFINESDTDEAFQSVYTTIITNIKNYLGKDSGWIIDSVIDHTISISKHYSLAGSSYIKSKKELDHPRKGLINIQNVDDNECFKLNIVRYSNPAYFNPVRITIADNDLAKKLDFKDIKFLVKI